MERPKRRVRAIVRTPQRTSNTSDADAVWMIHEWSFAKKGNNSVGVHRQFARSIGKKINCQVAVFVSQVGPLGYFPLATRLYLPQSWLQENDANLSTTIPDAWLATSAASRAVAPAAKASV